MKIIKILSVILAVLMFTSVCASAKTLEFTLGNSTVYESSDAIKTAALEIAPYAVNGRRMVPVRIISESFGAQVDWNGETGEITIVKDDKTIILTLGNAVAKENGADVELDVAPEAFNGRTMVPLRFVSETLGMSVAYVASTGQIIITDNEALLTVNDMALTVDDYKTFLTYAGYDPEFNSAAEIVPYATDFLVQNLAGGSYVQALGVSLTDADMTNIRETINHYSDAVYKSALTAPLTQLMENDILLTNAVYSSLSSEEAIVLAQEKYAAEYVTAKHILITSEERGKDDAKKLAQEILGKLKKGEDFDTLMLEHNEDPGMEYFPDGYTFTKGEMVPEFEAAAFELEEGKMSELVETTYGYHIIKREALAAADDTTLNAIMNSLAEELYNNIVYEAVSNSEIKMYKTNDEIISLFE